MSSFRELYNSDIARYGSKANHWTKKFHYYLRKYQCCGSRYLKMYYHFRFKMLNRNRGIEFPLGLPAGKGLYLGHAYGITVNENTVIGENVNLHKGVTLGRENRGKREGAPTIGNMVWIGINSAVVGNITVGNDVLIAPGSYVNVDVPDHSIVLGNPCRIIPRDNATEEYINNMV